MQLLIEIRINETLVFNTFTIATETDIILLTVQNMNCFRILGIILLEFE